jgi:hypothetical protein
MTLGLLYRSTLSSPARLTVAVLGLLLLSGCGGKISGPERAAVKGSVSFDGAPVEDGSIVFLPATGTKGPSSGGTIHNGAYEITTASGPVPGKYRVEIRAMRSTGTKVVKGAGGATEGPSSGGEVTEMKMYIPVRYNAESMLVADISLGDNQKDFPLKSNP